MAALVLLPSSLYFQKMSRSNLPWESLVTISAYVWLLPSVNHCVNLKMIFLWERCVSIATFVWSLPCVLPWMMLKITVLQEWLITMAAKVWLLPSVWSHVYLKMIFLWESIFTIDTFVWSLSCVFHPKSLIKFFKLCILKKLRRFWFPQQNWCGNLYKELHNFSWTKFSDSQQGHIALFNYNGCKAYAIYLSLGLFYTNIVHLIKKWVHIQ